MTWIYNINNNNKVKQIIIYQNKNKSFNKNLQIKNKKYNKIKESKQMNKLKNKQIR